PRPPAAPAPGRSASPGGHPSRSLSSTRPNRRSAESSSATAPGEAPFCGPNTALAPAGPVSGLSTSAAPTSRTARSRGTPGGAAPGRRRGPAVGQRIAGLVQWWRAERGEQPGTGVVGSRATQTDDYVAYPRLDRDRNERAEAE